MTSLLLHFFAPTSIHDSPYYACISHLITMLVFVLRQGVKEYLFCDLPSDNQMVWSDAKTLHTHKPGLEEVSSKELRKVM